MRWIVLTCQLALAACGGASRPEADEQPERVPAAPEPAGPEPTEPEPTEPEPIDPEPAEPEPAGPEIETSAGCGKAPQFAGDRVVTVAGKQRQFLVQVPTGYDPQRRYPVLFGLHGAGGSGPSYANGFPLRAAWQDRAILVFPSALFYEVDGRTTWRYPTEENLDFFDAMVDELQSNLCVDHTRIFASGFSSGGFFSNTLGCRRGDVVRAIVPVAGGDRDFNDSCVGNVAVMVISSPLDSTDPTGGPPGISHHERGLRARDYFRQHNGCSDETLPLQPEGCVAYQGCQAGAEVHYCEHQQGHAWPSALHAPAADFLASY